MVTLYKGLWTWSLVWGEGGWLILRRKVTSSTSFVKPPVYVCVARVLCICVSITGLGYLLIQFSHSVMSDSATPWTAACQASLSITNSQSLLKLMSIESVMPSNHLILCCPLLLPPSIFLSIRVFSIESVLSIRWPKYWSFSFWLVYDFEDSMKCDNLSASLANLMSSQCIGYSSVYNHWMLVWCCSTVLFQEVYKSIFIPNWLPQFYFSKQMLLVLHPFFNFSSCKRCSFMIST